MYKISKRLLDLTVASICLLLLSPLLIPIIVLLRLTGEGEVFYLQERIGYKNKPFNILKFATMLKNSPNMKGGEITLRNDPRVTMVGKYLRITKLNELPQLFNVFMGHMSLVGPRPLMKVSFEKYTPNVQDKIYDSKPGITGVGSVVFRDEENMVTHSGIPPREFYDNYIFPYKGKLEMWYQENKSFRVDIYIFFLTIWVIISPKSSLPFTVLKDVPPPPKFITKTLA